MKIFKLTTNDTEHYQLNQENFESKTNLQSPWYDHNGGKERHFAVCPACNNSTQIIHLYDKTKVLHAKHFLKVSVGEQNQDTLKYCPHYSNKPVLTLDNKRGNEDEITLEIKNRLIENFDRVVYFIQKTIGLRLPYNKNKMISILQTYQNSRGWMYTGANLINIPWIFLYQCRSQTLTGMAIKSQAIKTALTNYNSAIKFNDYNQIIYPKGTFLDLNLCFINHKQSIKNHELNESITLKITDAYNATIYSEAINFDHDHFTNLINSTNEQYRNYDLINLAKDVLNAV